MILRLLTINKYRHGCNERADFWNSRDTKQLLPIVVGSQPEVIHGRLRPIEHLAQSPHTREGGGLLDLDVTRVILVLDSEPDVRGRVAADGDAAYSGGSAVDEGQFTRDFLIVLVRRGCVEWCEEHGLDGLCFNIIIEFIGENRVNELDTLTCWNIERDKSGDQS